MCSAYETRYDKRDHLQYILQYKTLKVGRRPLEAFGADFISSPTSLWAEPKYAVVIVVRLSKSLTTLTLGSSKIN